LTENAGVENKEGAKTRGGKCRSGIIGMNPREVENAKGSVMASENYLK